MNRYSNIYFNTNKGIVNLIKSYDPLINLVFHSREMFTMTPRIEKRTVKRNFKHLRKLY